MAGLPPLVLLHGFLGAPSCFDAAVASVQLIRHPQLRPRLGDPPPQIEEPSDGESLAFAREVQRLSALLDAFSAEPVTLAGYSMGGRLALALALANKARIRRLILISARRGLDHEDERRERREADDRWATLLERDGLDAFLTAWWQTPLFATLGQLPQASLDIERNRRRRLDPQSLAWSLRHLGLGSQPSFAESVRGLDIPVTLVTGSLDHKFTAIAEGLAAELPNSKRIVVEGHGHSLLLEAPDVIGRVLAEE